MPAFLRSLTVVALPPALATLALAITAVAITIALPQSAAATDLPERFTTPQAREAGQRVAALGRIEPIHGVIRLGAPAPLASTTGLLIRELFVEEGDDIQVGQELAITDIAGVLQAVTEETRTAIDLARQQARAAQSQAEESCVLAEVREREAERREALLAREVVTAEESERARADARLAAATCQSARDQARAIEAAVPVAEAAHQRAQAEYERSRIVSPINGRVLDILARPGELVGLGGAIEVAKTDRMQAIAEVYEADLPRIALGQPAEVSSPVLERSLTGTVRHIRPRVRKQDETDTDPAARKDARIVEVEILLDQPEAVAGLTNLQVTVLINP